MLHKQSNDHIASFDGCHYLVDSMTGIIAVDRSVITKSFEAHGVIDTSPGMSKGSISFFSKKSMKHVSGSMQARYDIDVSKPNMTVVTHVELDKAINVVV